MAKEEDLILGEDEPDQDDLFGEFLDIQYNLRENIDTALSVYTFLDRLDPQMFDPKTEDDIKQTKFKCFDIIFENMKQLTDS